MIKTADELAALLKELHSLHNQGIVGEQTIQAVVREGLMSLGILIDGKV